MTFDYQSLKTQIFQDINDQPRAATATLGSNPADLISKINSLLDQLKADLNQIDQLISDNANSLSSAQTTLAANSGAIASIQSDIGAINTDISAIETTITQLQNDLATAQSTLGTNEGDISVIQNTISTLQNTLSTAQGDIAGNTNLINESLTSVNSTITALQSNLEEADDTIAVKLQYLFQQTISPSLYLGLPDGSLVRINQELTPIWFNDDLLGDAITDIKIAADRSLLIAAGDTALKMALDQHNLSSVNYGGTNISAIWIDTNNGDDLDKYAIATNYPILEIWDRLNNSVDSVNDSNADFLAPLIALAGNDLTDEIIGIDQSTPSNLYRFDFNDLNNIIERSSINGVTYSALAFYEGNFVSAGGSDVIYTGSTIGELRQYPEDDLTVVNWVNTDHTDQVNKIDYDDDGMIYTCSNDTTIKQHDSSGATQWTFSGFSNPVIGLAVDKNSNEIYCCDNQGLVKKLDNTGAELASQLVGVPISILAFG